MRRAIDDVLAHLHSFAITDSFRQAIAPAAAALRGISGLVPLGSAMSPSSAACADVEPELDIFVRDYALRCVAWGIALAPNFPPTEDDWNAAAARAFRAWRSSHVGWLVVAHVDRAMGQEFEEIDLCPGFLLIRDFADEAQEIEDGTPRMRPSGMSMAAIVGRLQVSKSEPPPCWQRDALETLKQCVRSLRLIVPGHYGIEEVWLIPDRYHFQTGPLVQWADHGGDVTPSSDHLGDFARITPEHGEQCARMVQAWKERKLASLAVALQRFNLASTRVLMEDQIIDLVVALEGSLLTGNVKDQLKYRCAIRGAYLLGDEDDPTSAAALLQAAYDARSAIVHGAKRLPDLKPKQRMNLSPEEFITKCHDIVRRVLVRFVYAAIDGTSAEEFAQALDAEVLRRLDRRPLP